MNTANGIITGEKARELEEAGWVVVRKTRLSGLEHVYGLVRKWRSRLFDVASGGSLESICAIETTVWHLATGFDAVESSEKGLAAKEADKEETK